ncbi:MAG: proline--tRNA ligase [Acidaminococcus sp.]|jgi:prolyl-tRNA synthetase|nr:proline--tRNA ligase [Acidaminococcus sp.]MCI2099990.1 proline--tRNA ligase [Acidaminococcus sp.]MCI2114266.1 proline--tRNA ligase [Acidaminococcus sp.]MCI2116220.1 proline--tRNA ligase [Acidaminococcus sp.]
MRVSKLYAPTLREVPAEAVLESHKLMLRAGYIRKLAGGLYTYLPLAWRSIKKIEQIIREEMDCTGAQEIMMPIVQPSEIWKESGRWDVYGAEMFRLRDRHSREFCLGPTHEEMITTLVKNELHSYRQLPTNLYQIQSKFRDEKRPRFGLMRSREFIMKDAYSFDADEAGLDESYKKMYDAYSRIFDRCALKYRPVEADPGAIGGNGSHEFMGIADSGEAGIVYCDTCDYAADVEKAECAALPAPDEAPLPLEKKNTPGCNTIEAVCDFLKAPILKSVKAVAFTSDKGGLVLCFVRGDHEVNEIKVTNAIGANEVTMAPDDMILAAGTVPGFMGPIGLDTKKCTILIDSTVMNMHNVCCGANEKDTHYVNAEPSRDFVYTKVLDIRTAVAGDKCPHCEGHLKEARGIEVGQVFKLYTKYSAALGATFLDPDGKEKPMYMGSYGIGVGRTLAAVVEQYHDKNGMIMPKSIAPYEVIVLPVNMKDEPSVAKAEEIYNALNAKGIEAIIDDRDERAGVKFKDADLIGYPVRIVVGPKTMARNAMEVKVRYTGEMCDVPLESDYVEKIKEILDKTL